MKITGTTEDGRQIMSGRVKGVVVETVETVEERDLRQEAEAYELVRNTAPELLQACRGLLAVIEANFPSLKVEKPINGEQSLDDDDVQAIDYALTIVRKVDPDYGKEIEPPAPVQLTP